MVDFLKKAMNRFRSIERAMHQGVPHQGMPKKRPKCRGRDRAKRIRLLWREQCGVCWYCEEPAEVGGDLTTGATVDHVVPLSKGGTNSPENLVMACGRCNFEKADRMTMKTKTPERLYALQERVALRHPALFKLLRP